MQGHRARPGLVLPIITVLLAAMFAAGALAPRGPDFDALFGVEAWRAPGPVALAVAFCALLALLLIPGAADRLGKLLGRAVGVVPRAARLPILILGLGAAFWFLPTARLSGDASATMIRAATGHAYSSNPLTSWIQAGVRAGFGLYPAEAVRLVSVFAGMVFVFAAVRIGRRLFPGEAAGAGLAGLLLTAGTAVLFFGSIEVYAPLAAALALYLLLGLRSQRDGRSVAAPAVALGIAFGLHGSAGLLLPSLFWLANGGRVLPLRPKRLLGAGLLFLLPVVAVYSCLYLVSWGGAVPEAGPERYGSFLGGMNLGPILPLVKTDTNVLNRYALIDLEHFVGVLNLIVLAAPVGVMLLLLSRGRAKGDPAFRFVAIAAVFLVLFPNFWNANYALRLDWDLFSLMGIPLTILGGMAFFASRRGAGPAVSAVAVSLFCLVPLVISNVGTTYEKRQSALRCRSAMQRAERSADASDQGLRARLSRAERHYAEAVERLDPGDTEGRAARALALAESGQLREAEVGFRGILAEEPRHTGALAGLGFVLAQLGSYPEARTPLLEALTAEPSRLPCRLILTRIDLQQGDLGAAIRQMENGIRRGATHPLCARALSELARLREHHGDQETAAELDRQATERGFHPESR